MNQEKESGMEIIKLSSEDSVKKFNALKSLVGKQADTLKAIKVTDANSLAIANQQLSESKSLINKIEAERVAEVAPALAYQRGINKLAKDLVDPLTTEDTALRSRIIAYDNEEAARKKKELEEIAAKQFLIEQAAKQKAEELKERIEKYKTDAFTAINNAMELQQLSDAYTTFFLSFPAEYGADLKEKIKALGSAKQKALVDPAGNSAKYEALYNEYLGIEIKPPVVQAIPVSEALKARKAELQFVGGSSSIRKSWDFEVVDFSLVPRDLLMIDEKKVKEYIKLQKDNLVDGAVINGIRYFIKKGVVAK